MRFTHKRKLETRLELAQEAGGIGFWDWDLATGTAKCSAAYFRLYGLPASDRDPTYEEWLSRIHPEDRERAREDTRRVIENAALYESDYRVIWPDGSLHWLGVRGRLVRDETGQPCRVIGVIIDLTERKRVENALAQSEARFRALAESGPQIVYTCRGEDGQRDWVSAQWYHYTGAMEFSDHAWAEYVHPEDRERVSDRWMECLRSGEPFETQFRYRRAGGSYGWHLSRAVPVKDDAGRIIRWVGTSTDISEIREAAETRERLIAAERAARAEAESANRVKDEFLATLSHELRTPLANIVSWASVVQGRYMGNDPQIRRGLGIIVENAMAQGALIGELLDIDRIVRGMVTLDARTMELTAFIEQCVAAHRLIAEAKAIELRFESLLAGSASVQADAARLRQVLGNMVSNSIKFTPPGGHIRVTLREAAGGYEITVQDSGEGIEPGALPHVFERFRQADSSVSSRHGGLGLGLAIVKQLVDLHGGTVRAESAGLGQGATFTVWLPVDSEATLGAGIDHSERERSRGPIEVLDPGSLKGIRVLVIANERSMLEHTCALLAEHGARVLACTSAREALELLQRDAEPDSPRVLVSDFGMPEIDGYALLRAVRREMGLDADRLPALAVMAFARKEDRVQAFAAGFQACLTRPYEPGELIALVAELGKEAEVATWRPIAIQQSLKLERPPRPSANPAP